MNIGRQKYLEYQRIKSRNYRKRHLEECRSRDRAKMKKAYKKIKLTRKFNTPKNIARRALGQAVFYKKIVKPDICSRCKVSLGKRFIHGHHHDYTKPYDVIWLCAPCHGFEHRKKSKFRVRYKEKLTMKYPESQRMLWRIKARLAAKRRNEKYGKK